MHAPHVFRDSCLSSGRRPAALAALLLAACGSEPAPGAGTPPPVDPLDLAFGTVRLGHEAERTVDLREAFGAGELVVDGATVAAPWFLDPPPPVRFGAEEPARLALRFRPTVEGPVSTSALLRTGKGDWTLELSGAGGPPAIRCTPAAVEFGRPVAGTVREAAVLCEAEGGDATIAGLSIADPLAEFAVEEAAPLRVDGGGVTLHLSHAPVREGPWETELRIDGDGFPIARIPLRSHVLATAVELPAGLGCPRGLDLGFAPEGFGSGARFVLRNVGDRPYRVSAAIEGSRTLALTTPPSFEVPADDPATEVDESEVELGVSFTPEYPGLVSGVLRLATTDPGRPEVEVCLSAFGGGPRLACAPAVLDFGAVASGAPRALALRCENAGTDVPDRDDDRLVLASALASDPAFRVDPGALPAAGLAPGEGVDLLVEFAPVREGAHEASATIECGGPVPQAVEVGLRGHGRVLGSCSHEVIGTFAFGPVETGASLTLAAAIRNLGPEDCLLRVAAIEGSPSFSLPPGVPSDLVVPAGELGRVPVVFAPAGAGAAAGVLRLELSSREQPVVELPLSGTGTASPSCLAARAVPVDFGTVLPGCSSFRREVLLVNGCGRALSIEALELRAGAGAFRLSDPPPALPLPLADGGSAPIALEYRPVAAGADHGALVVREGGVDRLAVGLEGRSGDSAVDRFPGRASKIDVLLVLENGGTGPQQAAFRQHAGAFLGPALAAGVDFQLGVTTTGIQPVSDHCPGGGRGGEDGRLFPVDASRPRILGPATPDLLTALGENLLVGDCGSSELPLEAMRRALSPPVIDHADDPRYTWPHDGNLGFLRPDARLAVVFLAQEDDQSPGAPAGYADFLRRLKPPGRASAHLIGGEAGTGCSGSFAFAQPADRLHAVVAATSGSFFSFCAPDWSGPLATLGGEVFGRRRFVLGAHPVDANGDGRIDDRDLTILVDGQPWTESATEWRHDAASNTVTFSTDAAPAPIADVEFRYAPTCPESP